MKTKDITIYNAVANVAADIFNKYVLNQPGKYTVSDLKALDKKHQIYYRDTFDELEIIHFEFDGFSCKFPAGAVFSILADLQTAWEIPTACRAEFVKKADAAPVAVSFAVPELAKTIIKAVSNDKKIYTATNYICIDTRRRAVVGCNGRVLTAAAVPEMYVNSSADFKVHLHPNSDGRICVDPVLFKSGKGTLSVDENGNAVNSNQTREIYTDLAFPAWANILPAISEDAAVQIGAPAFREMKKAILAAAKFSNTYENNVILRAVPGIPEIQIIGYRSEYNDEKTAKETKTFKVSLPAPVAFAFTVAISGKDINAVAVAEKMYLISNARPLIFTAGKYFALLTVNNLNTTPWENETFTAPAGTVSDVLSVCRFPLLDEENSAAAVASVQDAPADEETPAPVSQLTGSENDVYIKYNADFETPFYLDANGAPVAAEDARAAFEDEETPAYFENLGAEDEENARVAFAAANVAPAVQDEETAAPADSVPAAEDETETARAAFAEILARGRADQETAAAVAFAAAAADSVPAVQDAAPVAVSLPVPVSAVNNWFAVYNSANSLHGVYFSRLLADELLFNSLFVPGNTWNILTVQDPSAAPAEFVPAVASVQDEETAPAVQDETPAPFASIFAIMPEIWETAAPVAEDEETPAADSVPFLDEETNGAPFAAEDAPAVAAFYLAAEFSRRARRVFNVAAALLSLLLITAAPRFIASVQDEETAPAVQETPAPAFILDEETAAPADSVPADRMKQPRNARKRARRAVADSVAAPVPFAADSVRADSVPFVAAADSLPAVASVPADSVETAPAVPVAVQETPAPAEDEETAAPVQDEETETNGAPADSVPAEDAPAPANSPAPAVPVAVPGCPAVPAALLLILML